MFAPEARLVALEEVRHLGLCGGDSRLGLIGRNDPGPSQAKSCKPGLRKAVFYNAAPRSALRNANPALPASHTVILALLANILSAQSSLV